jgi:hypothetical protein
LIEVKFERQLGTALGNGSIDDINLLEKAASAKNRDGVEEIYVDRLDELGVELVSDDDASAESEPSEDAERTIGGSESDDNTDDTDSTGDTESTESIENDTGETDESEASVDSLPTRVGGSFPVLRPVR